MKASELKNHLRKYLAYAKAGEEVIICERNRPVAMLVPVLVEGADDHELALIAAGKMRPPKEKLDVEKFLKMPILRVGGHKGTDAIIAGREET